MKKIGKKVSFLTKIMLVIGLLISNLSSLSVVFAAEVTIDVSVVEDKLNIKYLDELAEDVETVRVNVYENYTYLDMTSDEVISNYDLTSEELDMLVSSEEGKVLVVDSILASIIFDGTYDVKVEIVDTTDETLVDGEVIDTREFSMELFHDSGLDVNVIDTATGLELEKLEDGRYSIDYASPEISVVANVLAGGLKPTDTFKYNDQENIEAEELLKLQFSSNMDFSGRLYGEYTLPVEVKLLNSSLEEIVYSSSVDVLYGEYLMDAMAMNMAVATEELSLSESYVFYGDTKDGVVYVLLDDEKTNTMLDLYRIANFVFEGDDLITYLLSNSEYEDVLKAYNDNYNAEPTEAENSEVVVADTEVAGIALEEFLESILLDDTAMLSLINEGLTVTYKVVVAGDLNNDHALTEEDLLELVNQVVGKTEVNTEKSDLYATADEEEGTVNTLDVMYLDQVMKNDTWYVELTESEASLNARLDVMEEDIVSGDEFTVNYVLTLSDYAVNGVSGILNYDTTMLELVSVETSNEWLGNSNEGHFLYLGTESLTGTVTEGEEGEVVVTPNEYVVVTATFRALMAGTSLISVEMPEYFDQDTYLVLEKMEISTEVVVNASDNNNLSSLTVAGQTIVLDSDVLDYEITVGNDVTTAEVEAMVENVAANITSIISPEELVEGENTVTITVVSESGNEKIYTVTIIREEAPEEETTTTQVNYNNYYNDYEEEDNTEVVTPAPEEEDPDDKDDTTKEEKDGNVSRIIIIILILLVIAGLIYLIFKDDEDAETKKANKEINKLKKEVKEPTTKLTGNNKNKNTKNKKK